MKRVLSLITQGILAFIAGGITCLIGLWAGMIVYVFALS